MPATIAESAFSRPFRIGRTNSGWELEYHVVGTDDDLAVIDLIEANAPTLFRGRLRDGYDAEPKGGGVWSVVVRYASLDDLNEFTFDTGGGTSRITQSLTTVATFAPSGLDAPNFQGAIGVSEDRVEGVEIGTRAYEWTETKSFLPSQVTQPYVATLRNLTFTYNNAPFRGFAAGEVLFMGCTGGIRGGDLFRITYRFASSENVTGQVIGDITGVAKAGWDYLWVRYADYEDGTAKALVKRPRSVHVERVYFPADFALLGIGTASLFPAS
jgi:hypothetical protein